MRRVALIAIIFATVTIRVFNIPTRTIFNNCDELITVTTCSGLVYRNIPNDKLFNSSDLLNAPIKETLKSCAFGGYGGDNGNCYFFNLVLTFWTKAFGISESAFRAFSIVCDVLIIILIYLICSFLNFNIIQTSLSCILLAISPIFVTFGGDFIRTYSFTTMLTLLSVYLFLRVYKEPERKWFYFLVAISLGFMFFSHFLSYYVFGAFLFFALLKRKQSTLFFKRTTTALIVCGLMCVGILSLNEEGISDMKKRNSELKTRALAMQAADPAAEKYTARTITFSSIKYILSYYTGTFSLTGFANGLGLKLIPFLLFVFFLVIPILFFVTQYKEIIQKGPICLLWFVVLSGNASAFFIMLFSKHFTSLDIRYSIFTIPVFFILAAFSNSKHSFVKNLGFILLPIFLIGLIGTFNRYATKEISFDQFDGKKLTVAGLPDIKKNFMNKLVSLAPADTIGFNNPDDYIFYVLITEGKYKNNSIISASFAQGLSCVNKPDFLIPYKYYGTD